MEEPTVLIDHISTENLSTPPNLSIWSSLINFLQTWSICHLLSNCTPTPQKSCFILPEYKLTKHPMNM